MTDFLTIMLQALQRLSRLRMAYVFIASGFLAWALRPLYPPEHAMPELIMILAQLILMFLLAREFITGHIDVDGQLLGRIGLFIAGLFVLIGILFVAATFLSLSYWGWENAIQALVLGVAFAAVWLTFFLVPSWASGDRAPFSFLRQTAWSYAVIIVPVLLVTFVFPLATSTALWSAADVPESLWHDLALTAGALAEILIASAIYARMVRPQRNKAALSSIPTVSSLQP